PTLEHRPQQPAPYGNAVLLDAGIAVAEHDGHTGSSGENVWCAALRAVRALLRTPTCLEPGVGRAGELVQTPTFGDHHAGRFQPPAALRIEGPDRIVSKASNPTLDGVDEKDGRTVSGAGGAVVRARPRTPEPVRARIGQVAPGDHGCVPRRPRSGLCCYSIHGNGERELWGVA